MNIGFDLDGVLYPWQEVIHKYCLDHNITHDSDETKFWTSWAKANEGIMSELVLISEFYHRSSPYPGVIEMLLRLAKKHTIYYITGRPKSVEAETFKYLLEWGFPSPTNLMFVSNKARAIQKMEIKAYAEDRIELAMSMCLFTKTFLVTRPYNKAFVVPDNITRVDSVLAVERLI